LWETPKAVQPRQTKGRDTGKREMSVGSQSADGQPCTIGCISENKHDRLKWEVDVSKTGKLHFLVDTDADISLIRSTKLLGDAVFDPNRKISVRGVDGYGVIEVGIQEGNFKVRFPFHLVNKQIGVVMAIPGVKRKMYTPDGPYVKNRTS
jgi:hypothetical protein